MAAAADDPEPDYDLVHSLTLINFMDPYGAGLYQGPKIGGSLIRSHSDPPCQPWFQLSPDP